MCSTRESLPYAPGAARSLHHADKLASIGLYLELQTRVLYIVLHSKRFRYLLVNWQGYGAIVRTAPLTCVKPAEPIHTCSPEVNG